MKKKNDEPEFLLPQNQLSLYGYDKYFDFFIKLYKNQKLPKVSLISGPKGIGKSTFIYHIVNYLLSAEEDLSYSIKEKSINLSNKSFKLTSLNLHPNFVSIHKKEDQKKIGIDEIRKLLSFLNKTTYLNNLKIVLIDNAEDLNINSVNALLKTLEEPTENTFFFIIHNHLSTIPPTIKSRSIEFKIFFNYIQKKEIFFNLLKNYKLDDYNDNVLKYLFLDTPGNLLKYYSFVKEENSHTNFGLLKNIFLSIEKYQREKNSDNLSLVSFFVEKFYNQLILANPSNQINCFFNRAEVLKKIDLLRKFNLDEKNIFLFIENTLKNEAK